MRSLHHLHPRESLFPPSATQSPLPSPPDLALFISAFCLRQPSACTERKTPTLFRAFFVYSQPLCFHALFFRADSSRCCTSHRRSPIRSSAPQRSAPTRLSPRSPHPTARLSPPLVSLPSPNRISVHKKKESIKKHIDRAAHGFHTRVASRSARVRFSPLTPFLLAL